MGKFFKDTVNVFTSNLILLVSGILSGFILPKIMLVNDYGLYKIFVLYTSYTGLCQLGFLDGIAIKYGGDDYDEINKQEISQLLIVFISVQILFSAILIFLSIYFFQDDYKIISFFLAFHLLLMNVIAFYQTLSKITLRFRELTHRNILQAFFNIIVIVVFLFLFKEFGLRISSQLCIVASLFTYVILVGMYVVSYKELLHCRSFNLYSSLKSFFLLSKKGLPVMIAYLCSTLILVLDRQFVSVLFDAKTFAVYAFAYALLALMAVASRTISTVVYPNLKRIDKSVLTQKYSYMISIILLLSFAGLMSYYPLCWFVNWFIPKYADSLTYFRIVLPGVAISAAITIVMQNYYVALDKGRLFFKISAIILALAFVSNSLAYLIFKSAFAISVTSIIVTIVWYVFSENYFVRVYRIQWLKNLVYLLMTMGLFYFISGFQNWVACFFINLFVYLFLSLAFFKKEIITLLNMKKKMSDF